MKLTITPPAEGPYRFDPVDLVITDVNAEEVATVSQRKEPTEDSDETSATGWLLTAAPDLLAACREALRCTQSTHAVPEQIDWILHRAIRKAEGRPHLPYRVFITEKQGYMIDLWATDAAHAKSLAQDNFGSEWKEIDGRLDGGDCEVIDCDDEDFAPANG